MRARLVVLVAFCGTGCVHQTCEGWEVESSPLLNESADAVAGYQAQLKKRPRDVNLLTGLAAAHAARGQWPEAEASLRKAVAADKACGPAWEALGAALARQRKYQEALDAWGKVQPPAGVQVSLAVVLREQGKRDEARAACRRALELDPSLAAARTALAELEAAGS